MSDQLSEQVNVMFNSIFQSVDRTYFRPFKRQMFNCGHDCLDDSKSYKDSEKCIDDCGKTLQRAMQATQEEITAFQGRLDRCLIDCQDDARKEKDDSKARVIFDGCAEKCVVKFKPGVPDVIKRVTERLDKIKKEANVA